MPHRRIPREVLDARRTRQQRRRGFVALLLAIALPVLPIVPGQPASAAGAGQLLVTLAPIDVADNSPITTIAEGQHNDRITYQVQYRCTADACVDTQLQFSPSAPDPNGLLPADRYLLQWESWVPPSGASISGTDATGKTVSLGTLAAGSSGTFTMTYVLPTDRHRDVPWGSFYPDGFQIEMSATASSPSVAEDVTGHSAPVTWRIALPGGTNPAVGPQVGITAPASVRTDAAVDYNLTMNSGVLFYGSGANVTGDASLQAAGSYEVVYHAPAEAVIVAAEHGGVIDADLNTVTWTMGSANNPEYAARGGWGLNLASGFNGGGPALSNPAGSAMGDDQYALWRPRAVTLEFPGDRFAAADADGCNFATTVSSSISATVTYLDDARTTKTATAQFNNQVACWDAFGGINVSKLVHGGASNQYGLADGNMGGGLLAVNVPNEDQSDRTALYWRVTVSNRGNLPGIAVIDEPNLSLPDAPVYQMWPLEVGATVEWERSDGVTGTTTLAANQMLTAPGTTYFVSARATTTAIPAGRIQRTDTTERTVSMNYRMRISPTAPIGQQRTNSAQVTMSYPDAPDDLEVIPLGLEQTIQRTIQFTRPSPVIAAAFTGAPVVQGGGALIPGTSVTYSMNATTNAIWPGTQIRPQLVFIAPVGWEIEEGTAAVSGASGAVTYQYATRVVGGVSREVVVATWGDSVTPSTVALDTWPTMTVRATPTSSAPTATGAAVALVWAGDASGTLTQASTLAYVTDVSQFRATSVSVQDTGDIDGDSILTEYFAQGPASGALTVAAPSAVQVLKELCVPDSAAVDGCQWVSDASQEHFVPVTADDVRYRITVTNPSASALTNVVAYDVLPHVGDVGLLAGGASRGSQFDMTLAAVTSVSPGVTMSYSSARNPSRTGVYPSAPGAVDDWDVNPNGKAALQMSVGSLAAGASVTVEFTAAVSGSPSAGQRACNTVALGTDQSLPTEPLAVCVTLAEADLRAVLSSFDNLQAGRPSTIGYTVTNLGGTEAAPGSAIVEIGEGMSLTSLDVDQWNCELPDAGTTPAAGPVSVTCTPVDGNGAPRALERDEPEEIRLPVVVDAEEGQVCTSGSINGSLYDPNLINNEAAGCAEVAPPPAGLTITKDDEQAATWIGAEYTYTITVTNTLVAEAVNDATVTDTLPASLELVEASGDPSVSGQTLTWDLAGMAPLASIELSVTVRVLPNATSPIINTASVTAPDPGFDGQTLSDSDEDRNRVLHMSIEKTSNARPSGVRVGDVITYTVTATADSALPHTGAVLLDDLSGVLNQASFVSHSAIVGIGDAVEALPDPVGDILAWSGTIPAGQRAVMQYQVTVEDSVTGELANAVSMVADPSECDTVTGRDEDGLACALHTTPYAPTIEKTVADLAQNDDGTWTIDYVIEVVNPAPTATSYTLSDALRFANTVAVTSAVVDGPNGVTLLPWEGSGDLAVDAELDAQSTARYEIQVVADAGAIAGTAAAVCADGQARGFTNVATITLSDDTQLSDEACAVPVKPSVAKRMAAAPQKGNNGRWAVEYVITVENPFEAPLGGLVYLLEDALDYPAGIVVHDVEVQAPVGAELNSAFTAGLAAIDQTPVTADTAVLESSMRIPAATSAEVSEHEYRVALEVSAPAGSVTDALLACGDEGAGYGNWATLVVGEAALGRATACADIRLPELQFTKTATAPSGTRPGDTVRYRIVATNVGDADFTEGDPAELHDAMTDVLDDARYLEDAAATSGALLATADVLAWTGQLASGESVAIEYSVRLQDAGSGNGDIVNVVWRGSGEAPSGAIPNCAATPAGNADADACAVRLQLDPRSLAATGNSQPLVGIVLVGIMALGGGVFLQRRLRRRSS